MFFVNHNNTIFKKIGNIISWVILVLSVMLSFSSIFWGLDMKDTFYMGSLFLYGDGLSAFHPLTQGIYRLIIGVFGNKIVIVRACNWLFFICGAIIIYFISKSNGMRNNKMIWLIFEFLVIPVCETNVFNGNSLTALFLCVLVTSIYLFSEKKETYLVGVVLATVCLLFCRFPNVVIIPLLLIFAFILFDNWRSRSIMYCSIGISLIFYLLINSILYKGLENYFSIMISAFSSNALADEADHSIAFLMQEYIHTVKDIISDIKYLSILAILPIISLFSNSKFFQYIIGFITIVGFGIFVYLHVPLNVTIWGYYFLMLLGSIYTLFTYLTCLLTLLHSHIKHFVFTLFLLFSSVISAAGSDTGLCLAVAPMVLFLPLLIGLFEKEIICTSKIDFVFLIISLVILSFASYIYIRIGMGVGIVTLFLLIGTLFCVSKLNIRSQFPWLYQHPQIQTKSFYNVIIVFFVVSLALYEKCNVIFQDKPINELTCQFSDPILNGIWSCKDNVYYVDEILNYVRSSENEVYFWGANSHVFSYISGRGIIEGCDFWQKETERNMSALNTLLKTRPVLIICPVNWAANQVFTVDEYPLINNLIRRENYKIVNKVGYFICIPQNDKQLNE